MSGKWSSIRVLVRAGLVGSFASRAPGQGCWLLRTNSPSRTRGQVRAASITCFAAITSSVFFSLKEKGQEFILFSCIDAATNDEVPSVRSTACRAVGVIACFPNISRSAKILQKFVNAAEINTRHHLLSVRIPASWAIANMCDSLRHCLDSSLGFEVISHIVESLSRCALRRTKDGDKVKSNAVRALGNIARVVPFSSPATCNFGKVPVRHCHGDQPGTLSVVDSSLPDFVGSQQIRLFQTMLQSSVIKWELDPKMKFFISSFHLLVKDKEGGV